MKEDKSKYLVISVGGMHEELLEVIKQNAQKEKSTVSHYVRSLLYKAIELTNDRKERPTGLDDLRAESSMGAGVRQSA